MAIPASSIIEFEETTRFPLVQYLDDYVNFVDVHRANVTAYYSGASKTPNDISFKRLENLLSQARRLNDVVDNIKFTMNSAAYWDLAVTISDVFTSLLTVDNSSKWMRSAIAKNNFSPTVEVEETLRMMQTLERLASELGSDNESQDWVSIALRNDLAEEDYNSSGGNQLLVNYRNKKSIRLKSVVDNITGDRVYGIDLNRTLTFDDDDLVALSPRETLTQSVEILSTLIQGDSPEFPGEGIQRGMLGTNRNSISYPILFRQYYNTFSKDDTLKSLRISNIEFDEDSAIIDFTVETRLGELIETQTSL